MLGVGLSCVGLSFSDFCALTPDEFNAVCQEWHRRQTELYRSDWERTRFIAFYSTLPHAKDPDNFRMHDLVKFEWEKSEAKVVPTKKDIETMKERFK